MGLPPVWLTLGSDVYQTASAAAWIVSNSPCDLAQGALATVVLDFDPGDDRQAEFLAGLSYRLVPGRFSAAGRSSGSSADKWPD